MKPLIQVIESGVFIALRVSVPGLFPGQASTLIEIPSCRELERWALTRRFTREAVSPRCSSCEVDRSLASDWQPGLEKTTRLDFSVNLPAHRCVSWNSRQ